jgi:hypothetical protein
MSANSRECYNYAKQYGLLCSRNSAGVDYMVPTALKRNLLKNVERDPNAAKFAQMFQNKCVEKNVWPCYKPDIEYSNQVKERYRKIAYGDAEAENQKESRSEKSRKEEEEAPSGVAADLIISLSVVKKKLLAKTEEFDKNASVLKKLGTEYEEKKRFLEQVTLQNINMKAEEQRLKLEENKMLTNIITLNKANSEVKKECSQLYVLLEQRTKV